MTAREALDAVPAERYGPPVRQVSGVDGPTARWEADQTVRAEIRRLYHDEKLPTAAVAERTGRPWREVVGVLEGWL